MPPARATAFIVAAASLLSTTTLIAAQTGAPPGIAAPSLAGDGGGTPHAGPLEPSVPSEPAAPADPALLYALGVIMSSGIDSFGLSEAEFAEVSKGLDDGYRHRASMAQAFALDPKLQVLRRARVQALTARQKAMGKAYLAAVAALPAAQTNASGLVYVPTREGSGAQADLHDWVQLNYEGKLTDGTVFDSSAARGQPATLQLTNVMRCFTEGLQLIKVGGKGRLVCPAELAYGDRGSAPLVPPGATVEYDVEILAVTPQRPANAPAAGARD